MMELLIDALFGTGLYVKSIVWKLAQRSSLTVSTFRIFIKKVFQMHMQS